MNKTYKAKSPPIAIRILLVFFLLVSLFFGLLKRWDGFGLSLGVLLIILITECHRLLSKKIDERFEQLENLINLKDEKTEGEQENK